MVIFRFALSSIPLLVACSDMALAEAAKNDAIVKPLPTQALAGLPGKEVTMLTFEYLPGGASLPHRHGANVFV